MAKNFQDWLSEGEGLYNTALEEYRGLESQLAELQERIAAKKLEVNQIARVIGKPLLDAQAKKGAAAPAEGEAAVDVVDAGQTTPYTRNSIARALTGQPIRR